MRPRLQILLGEDNPGDVLLIRAALNDHRVEYELHTTRDGSEA
ncbi:MAG: hypothetical protein JWN34_2586, partial [Bryobacterales bacterium]|nr:hypothetical protein [Bryobacterales bacterium]